MNAFQEGDLVVSFSGARSARRFDGAKHGLSHCMKAVDFVVELEDEYLYVEFKDPENPNAQAAIASKWIRDFENGIINRELIEKFRDSFIYEWAAGRAEKRISFFVLIAVSGQTQALLGPKSSALSRKLPKGIPSSSSWGKPVAHDCQIFDIESWNATFPNFQVRRLSNRTMIRP